jgi:tetratricopeptide (TPR) repeat protein
LGALIAQPNPQSDASVQQHLATARAAELRKDYESAAAEYQKVLRVHPNNALIHQSLGLTYHLGNQFAKAIPEFNRALQLDPKLWGADLFLGIDYYKTNQFDQALDHLQRSLKLNAPQAEPEASFWVAASHAALGHLAEAIETYRRTTELRPGDVEVLYQLARTYDEQAAAVFEQIGRIEPQSAAVFLLQGQRYAADNRNSLAAVAFRRALCLRPDYEGLVPSDTGGTCPPEENSRSGSDTLALNAAKTPGAAEFHSRTLDARREMASGRLASAEAKLRALLKQQPDNIDVLLFLGTTCQRQAESVLERMISISPQSPRVLQLQGEQQEAKGQFEEAIRSYQSALQRQPDQPGIRYAIGNAYWKVRQYDQAEQWLTEELKRNPYHGLAHLRLGSLYTEQGKADEAIPHLQQALRAHPDWIDGRFDLGRALVLKARYADAVIELKKVAAADPTNDRVHYLLSNALRKLGHSQDADAEMAKYQDLTRQRLQRAQDAARKASESVQ